MIIAVFEKSLYRATSFLRYLTNDTDRVQCLFNYSSALPEEFLNYTFDNIIPFSFEVHDTREQKTKLINDYVNSRKTI